MKRFHFAEKILLFLILCVFAEPAFCLKKTTKKDATNKDTTAESQLSSNDQSGSVKLPVPQKKYSYFSSINPEIIAEVENGTPASLKSAMRKIHKTSEEYTENERVLIFIASSIMEMVWPSEQINWTTQPVSEETQYTGAIRSVKNGVFDFSTGKSDFFTCLLPALLFLRTSSNQEINNYCYEYLVKAAEYNPDSILLSYLLGKFFIIKGSYKDAVQWLEKAYAGSEGCFEIAITYSEVLNKTGQFELSSSIINVLEKDNPDNIDVLKRNSYIAFDQGNLAQAEEYVSKILQQAPDDLEFVLFRAKILIEKKDYIHAVSLLDMYAKQNPLNADYLILRTKVQLDWSKNSNAATDTILKAIKLYPENPQVLMLAARISSITDSPVDGKYADEFASIVLVNNPENAEALLYALDGLMQRENWTDAYTISSRLVAEENSSSAVVLRHVKVCINYNKVQEALEKATKIYNKDKSDENAIQAYVLAYISRYSRDNSINLINSLMNTSTQKIKSFLYLRRSYLQRGEDNVLADLRSSLIANPRNDESLFRLYEIYFAKKDYRKAQYYLRQVVAIKPNDTRIKALNEELSKLIK